MVPAEWDPHPSPVYQRYCTLDHYIVILYVVIISCAWVLLYNNNIIIILLLYSYYIVSARCTKSRTRVSLKKIMWFFPRRLSVKLEGLLIFYNSNIFILFILFFIYSLSSNRLVNNLCWNLSAAIVSSSYCWRDDSTRP